MTEKTEEELNYSRPFDVHKWSDHPEVNRFVNDIWQSSFQERFESSTPGRRSTANPKYQLKVLLLDLYVAWLTDPDLLIGVGMSKTAYKAGSRYNELHVSAKMIDLINHCVDEGFIEKHTGSESAGRTTRIWPTSGLIRRFRQANFTLFDIGNSDNREVIILNSRGFKELATESKKVKPRPVEYDDSEFSDIPRMRDELENYNALLGSTFIDIPTLQQPFFEKEYIERGQRRVYKVYISQHNKFVRRIFYRGDWNKGGRFHGGWWQQIPEELRAEIYIDDTSTLELDYSGLHVNLLYGLKGVQPVGNPYSVDQEFGFEREHQRKIIKSLALMAINAESERKAFQAFRSEQPTGSLEKTLTNQQLKTLLDAFKKKNTAIEDDLCTDMGVDLMAIDGRITAKVINHFTRRNIPILTIHDSYIIQNQFSGELRREMNIAVAEELNGFEINIDQEGVGIDQIRTFQNMDRSSNYYDMYQQIPSFERTEEYNRRLRQFTEYLADQQ